MFYLLIFILCFDKTQKNEYLQNVCWDQSHIKTRSQNLRSLWSLCVGPNSAKQEGENVEAKLVLLRKQKRRMRGCLSQDHLTPRSRNTARRSERVICWDLWNLRDMTTVVEYVLTLALAWGLDFWSSHGWLGHTSPRGPRNRNKRWGKHRSTAKERANGPRIRVSH
jgi:hypothetical protein